MSNLYKLSHELAIIETEIEQGEGELTDDLERQLDDVSLKFDDKAHGIVRWIGNIQSEEIIIAQEVERLQKRQYYRKKKRERLKSYLLDAMETANIKKFDFADFTVSIANNPPSCEIEDERIIPAKYLTVIPESHRVRKADVLKDLKKGEEVPGAKMKERATRLSIK